jgi:hypothetical protein
MKIKVLTIGFFAFIGSLLSCNNNAAGDSVPETSVQNTDTSKFYPVKDFLQSQIQDLSSIPYFIYELHKEDNKAQDSSLVTATELAAYTGKFTAYDINDPALKPQFKESVFFDASLGTLTLSYSTKATNVPLKDVEVLMDENSKEVKMIFMSFQTSYTDSVVFERLGWEKNKSFYINRMIQSEKGIVKTVTKKVIWK